MSWPRCQVTPEDIYRDKPEALDLAYEVREWAREFFQEIYLLYIQKQAI